MSKEAAKNFIQYLETDEVLQDQVKNTENFDALCQIANDKGYEFTEYELQNYTQEAIEAGQLTEEDLFAVAGAGQAAQIQQQCRG